MPHGLDALDVAARESTRLVREPRQFRDAVVRHRSPGGPQGWDPQVQPQAQARPGFLAQQGPAGPERPEGRGFFLITKCRAPRQDGGRRLPRQGGDVPGRVLCQGFALVRRADGLLRCLSVSVTRLKDARAHRDAIDRVRARTPAPRRIDGVEAAAPRRRIEREDESVEVPRNANPQASSSTWPSATS